jgi:hypothetical protein
MRRRLAAVVTLALVFGGTATAATWPKRERNAADQALANRSILHLSDFGTGAGWTSAPTGGGGGANLDDPSCHSSSFNDVGRVLTGSAESSFKTAGLQVWSSAEVMKTLAMAQRDVRRTSTSVIVPCLTGILKKSLPPGTKFVSMKELAFPRVGDWSDAYRALVDVSANGVTVRVQFDMVLVQSSRVEITVMQVAPFAVSRLAESAEQRLVQRLAGAALVA